jgi:hypothetical protein
VDLLERTVVTQQDSLRRSGRYVGVSDTDLRGTLDYHKEAEILVASGGKIYVEMATSIIEAYKEKIKMRDLDVPIPNRSKSDQH